MKAFASVNPTSIMLYRYIQKVADILELHVHFYIPLILFVYQMKLK